MAYIIEGEHRPVIFCANYRCASTAIRDTILEMGGRRVRPGSQHHDRPEEIPPNALVVESVRDHFDVLESMWYMEECKQDWEEYIKDVLADRHIHLRAPQMYGKFKDITNYILRYETLEFEWSVLCQVAGLPEAPLRRGGIVTKKEIDRNLLFTYKQRDAIYNCYEEEMKRLGYGIGKL